MGVDFRTQAIHAGYEPLDNGRAAVPPIYASAAFDLGDAARGDALAGGDIDGFEYSRVANPTVDALEKRLERRPDGGLCGKAACRAGGRYRRRGCRLRHGRSILIGCRTFL